MSQSDSTASLNPVCLLKYVLNCEQNFSFFIFRFILAGAYSTTNISVTVFLFYILLHVFNHSDYHQVAHIYISFIYS
jgi:hypothetical protein